jgi:hypothetical protein
MTIQDTVLTELAPQPYAAIRDRIRDGDVLLCSANDFGSRMIRWATRSQWSHCAVAFRMPEIDRVLVLECVQRLGVRAAPLSDFVARTSSGVHPYPGRIVLARHLDLPTGAGQSRMADMAKFAFARLGAKFSNLETVKIGLRIALGRLNAVMPALLVADDEYICSEYVAKCFESIGLPIAWNGEGFIAPADIAKDPRIVAVAQIQTGDDPGKDRA